MSISTARMDLKYQFKSVKIGSRDKLLRLTGREGGLSITNISSDK
jgi:hypothetical protein